MKKILKAVLIFLAIIILAAACLVAWLSITEFKPAAVENVSVQGTTESMALQPGEEIKILCWNIGYGGLGKDSDFFMDGGKGVRSADKAQVLAYLEGIRATVDSIDADILLLQEVDADSKRSYGIDQREYFGGSFAKSAFAMNYSCEDSPQAAQQRARCIYRMLHRFCRSSCRFCR